MPNKIELNTFYFSIIILLLWCIVPGYFQTYKEGSLILSSVYSVTYFEEAFRFVLLFLMSYIGIFLIYLLFNCKKYLNNLYLIRKNNNKPFYSFLFPLYLFALYLIFINYRLESLLEQSGRGEYYDYRIILLIVYAILLFIYMRLSSVSKESFTNKIFRFSVLISYLIFPIADASRLVILPFIINIFLIASTKKNNLWIIPNLSIAIFALSSALVTRNELGVLNFFTNLSDFESFGANFENIISTLCGITQVSKALDIFSTRETYSTILLILYFSPLPGILVPKSASTINFNSPMGLDTNTGINTDIVSEWIFFFGDNGWIIGAFVFALITITPIELIKRGILKGFFNRILFQFTILYFFGAGYAMQLRSASRYFWYVFVVTVVLNYFNRNTAKKINKNLNRVNSL